MDEHHDPAPSALAQMSAERQRQIHHLGYTDDHDDQADQGELRTAAACYTSFVGGHYLGGARVWLHGPYGWTPRTNHLNAGPKTREVVVPSAWPWHPRYWQPSTDPVRNLVKAGALLAAEADRLLRCQQRQDAADPEAAEARRAAVARAQG